MNWRTQLLVIQTFILCGIVRALILLIPFKKFRPYLGEHNADSNLEEDIYVYRQAKKIGQVVSMVSRYTPWESKCLVQAMVAQYLLKRRKIPATLYLGVAKGSEGDLKAHAWLRCGQMIVTGDGARMRYKEVARFANLAV
ncbi:lasso peptide biosynthesis B2 protein [Niameybacter massiliensis]|uniref:lasso peptide biosynthesis B2 protein n=1 Tax=Niameybacter massiliensis TaxID=1658108 RepID=UPI001FA74E79|nr:lasso peptide biosynthesis B2 protein [Niameybacter massiliensis]